MLLGYYQILEIQPTKDLETIKKAFHRLAKQFHPDKNPQQLEWATEKFKLISEAYRLLCKNLGETNSNHQDFSEVFYDPHQFQEKYESKIPNYWETIKDSQNPTDQIKLMLHQLENEKESEGFSLFLQLKREMDGVDPLCLLRQQDYYDACLLIGEILLKRQFFEESVKYLTIYYRHIRIKLHRQEFVKNLKETITNVYKQELCQGTNKEMAIANYQKMLIELTFTQKEKALQLRDLAKLYLKFDEMELAQNVLDEALSLNPKLTGLKKMSEKLTISVK